MPFALPGERVRIAPDVDDDARATLVEVLEPSPRRREPVCPHFGVCGGCALQHWDPAAQRAWKREQVVEALERAGVAGAPVGEAVDASGQGRRRATLHAVRAKAVGFVFGFAKRASHAVFDAGVCPVLDPAIAERLPALRALAQVLLAKPGRLDVAVTLAQEGLDVDVRGVKRPSADKLSALAPQIAQAGIVRLIIDDEPVFQEAKPTVKLGDVAVPLPPGAFLQATHAGQDALTALVLDALGKSKMALDLYAGLGTFTLALAKRSPVHAMEGDARAVAALKQGAKAPGLKPVSAQRRDLAREPVTWRELRRFDAVVLDPPRAGAQGQAKELAKSQIARLAYVSCNPATFARDAAVLLRGEWRLDGVAVVDQFQHAPHVELVGAFSR